MNVAAICGSDGRTYNSECEIKRAACHGNPVVKQMEGACPENSKCRLERRFQQDIARRKNSSVVFIPECDETDGSYSIVQCHQSTGYCWCVTKTGRPLPGTSVRNKRPNCLPYGKVGRRSSQTNMGRGTGGCGTLDRSTFNSNLLKIFQSEYERDPKNRLKGNGRSASNSAPDKGVRVIRWKFDQLDRNKNGELSRRELRGQKRLIKKLIQPLACARRFNKYCDLDKNQKIDRREWVTCLSVDINSELATLRLHVRP
uniref:SPARC-related modular calcium-binding protein 1 n=1 Tax=Plectus sambesii TaxID=2011161 RepID=A0A914VLV2_9BILA